MPRDDGAWVPSPKPNVHACPTHKVSVGAGQQAALYRSLGSSWKISALWWVGGQKSRGGFPHTEARRSAPSMSYAGNSPESEDFLKLGINKLDPFCLPPPLPALSLPPWSPQHSPGGSRMGGGCWTHAGDTSPLCTVMWQWHPPENLTFSAPD